MGVKAALNQQQKLFQHVGFIKDWVSIIIVTVMSLITVKEDV